MICERTSNVIRSQVHLPELNAGLDILRKIPDILRKKQLENQPDTA